MKATAELKMLPVSVLKPAAYNPRKKLKPGDKEYEKIKNSITEFGFADPLVVNADMTIIGGHQRLTVAMDLGYTEVPCAVVDIDKTREKALNIALNKITGAWDDTLLADLLKDIEESNFDLGKTGFDPPEIETLFNKVHSKEVKEDDFDVESELKQPCFSKAGDLWMLGKHKVLCGDSTKAECYDTLMGGVKAMSIAGKRDGLDGSRSSLFYEAIRIVKEMRCKTNGAKPRFIVWENVPGAFSSNKGQDFKAVLEAVIGVKEPSAEVPAPDILNCCRKKNGIPSMCLPVRHPICGKSRTTA